jgi:hypothetical protein
MGILPVSEWVEGVRNPTENRFEGPRSSSQVVESGIFEIGFIEVILNVIEIGVEGNEKDSGVEGHHVVHSFVVSSKG